tara:strand:- start:240 stop:713 length:474 start_codon:yes stop_codon:yes gene_type:complete
MPYHTEVEVVDTLTAPATFEVPSAISHRTDNLRGVAWPLGTTRIFEHVYFQGHIEVTNEVTGETWNTLPRFIEKIPGSKYIGQILIDDPFRIWRYSNPKFAKKYKRYFDNQELERLLAPIAKAFPDPTLAKIRGSKIVYGEPLVLEKNTLYEPPPVM